MPKCHSAAGEEDSSKIKHPLFYVNGVARICPHHFEGTTILFTVILFFLRDTSGVPQSDSLSWKHFRSVVNILKPPAKTDLMLHWTCLE